MERHIHIDIPEVVHARAVNFNAARYIRPFLLSHQNSSGKRLLDCGPELRNCLSLEPGVAAQPKPVARRRVHQREEVREILVPGLNSLSECFLNPVAKVVFHGVLPDKYG